MLNEKVKEANSLVGFSDIKSSIEGWEEFLDEGRSYLQTAQGAYSKNRVVFTPEILYNIIAMAIEKFVMAALMERGAMPYNHTMGDLVEAMEETFPEKIQGLKKSLLNMDSFQEICDIDHFNITPPERKEISWMLDLGEDMKQLACVSTGTA